MAKYSKNYRFRGKTFRYDWDNAIVEWIYKDEETGLWEELDGVGLRNENWKNKEIRDEYLAEWCEEIAEETAYENYYFMKYEWPTLKDMV